jgi:hypothetical protein
MVRLLLAEQLETGYCRMSGYAFWAEWSDEPIAPRKSGTLKLLRQLCNAMEEESGESKRWKSCLIQYQTNHGADVEFEYESKERGKVDPTNYPAQIAAFRTMLAQLELTDKEQLS